MNSYIDFLTVTCLCLPPVVLHPAVLGGRGIVDIVVMIIIECVSDRHDERRMDRSFYDGRGILSVASTVQIRLSLVTGLIYDTYKVYGGAV